MPDLADVVETLRAAGCVSAEVEAQILLSSARTPDHLATMIERRASGEPLEYVVGWAEFCGQKMRVVPGVFVPRRRTEFLVKVAKSLAAPDHIVVDLCCGSGAIAAALLEAIYGLTLYATDIDPVAISCARHNMRFRGRALVGDLDAPLPATIRGQVDLVVANVPYVPTAEVARLPNEARSYEAIAALDGGFDGLNLVRRAARAAESLLATGGNFLVETSERQAGQAARIVVDAGLFATIVSCDSLDATLILGRKRLGSANRRRQPHVTQRWVTRD